MNVKLIAKQSLYVVLNVISGVLALINYIIPIYEYEWMRDPNMSKVVNSNAVLTIILFSILSFTLATIAFIPKRKVKTYIFIYAGLVLLIAIKFIQSMMLYVG